jgi:predicted Fe-Mo cluster-binding NifX family protein
MKEDSRVKIAVPIVANSFCSHFGGAEAFALYSIDEARASVMDRSDLVAPAHERGVFPIWLKQNGADVVLAGGMGPRAISIFAAHNIELVLGVEGDNPDELVSRYLEGTLESTGQACHDHGFHDCGHDHHHGAGRSQ